MSDTSLAACQLCQSAPTAAGTGGPPAASSAAHAPCVAAAAADSSDAARNPPLPRPASVRMEDHSVGHGLHRVDAAVERHEQEEREVDGRENARQHHIQAFRRLQAKDRKSTRLNSSHLVISYAVFCLKKKKNKTTKHTRHYRRIVM